MAYTALYRKWRPKDFNDVIGQDHIVKTLINQIQSDRIAHAYLFCGTRGTGKTSTAKIFAKAVNCENLNNGNPCNICETCKNIINNQNMNIVEIDAASNNGVDNIREIREEVKYTPTEGKYKVYIIDEVHMLSQGAFNALLKTLEEPPKHVIFILATTEPHKIPATILSRCQRFDFKRISVKTISKQLNYYMKQENIQADFKAIQYIAKIADGSMRDALSILDQCIAFYLGEDITIEKVLDVLGAVDSSVFIEVVDAIHAHDITKCMDIIEKITVQGRDLLQFVIDIIAHLRNLLIVKSVEQPENILDMGKEGIMQIKEQSNRLKEYEIIYYINVFSELESKIKYASQKRVLIEIEMIKLCKSSVSIDTEYIMDRLADIERKLQKGVPVNQTKDLNIVQIKEEPNKNINQEELINAIPEDIKKAITQFSMLIDRIDGIQKAILQKAIPAYLEDEHLTIICEDDIQKNILSRPQNISKINEELEYIHEKKFKVKILSKDEYDIISNEKEGVANSKEAKSIFEHLQSMLDFPIEER